MKQFESKHVRVLGIAPSSHGFGYAVMDGADVLATWGVKRPKANKNPWCLAKVADLIAQYAPDVIALEDIRPKKSRRGKRVRALIVEIIMLARENGIAAKQFSRGQLNLEFLKDEHGKKHDLAKHFAARFPAELGSQLPSRRRIWDNEDAWMDTFDAVALAGHVASSKPVSMDTAGPQT